MELKLENGHAGTVRAGYSCPCGCTPAVEYARGSERSEDGCCCGNRFAVGPHVGVGLEPLPGFRRELQGFDAPWGESLEAAWLIGPSVHGPAADHGDGPDHDHHSSASERLGTARPATDPVCGMSFSPLSARAEGLSSAYRETDYFFCGRGCKLDFDDDPERYLASSYIPSM